MRNARAPLLLIVAVLLHAFAAWHVYEMDEWLHGVDPKVTVFVWMWLRDVALAAVVLLGLLVVLLPLPPRGGSGPADQAPTATAAPVAPGVPLS